MKVLHITQTLDPKAGGICQALRSIIEGLKVMNIENEVLTMDAPNAIFIGDDNFLVHALGPAKTSWSYSSQLKPWLMEYLSNYDTIILHGLWQYQSYAIYKEWKQIKSKPKLYIMPHGMLDPYFQKAKGRKLKAIRNNVMWKLVEGKLINAADALLFTCEEERLLAHEPFKPYHPQKEVVVGLGVEEPPIYTNAMLKAFEEKVEGWNNKPFLLFLSRIHEKKGVELLISAYLAMKKKGVGLPQLVIAGPGLDTSYGQSIQSKAAEDSNILFPGMLSGEAKWGAFYNCEAFILPSHQENFGIAIVEALACSKPVLITNKINIWREVESDRAGLVAIDTEKGIFDLLEEWTKLSKEERILMIKNTRHSYITNFTIERNADRMIKVLNNI